MKFKCVDELDKFDFRDSKVESVDHKDKLLTIVFDSAVAKYNNPQNSRYQDMVIAQTHMRLYDPVIKQFFLEGPTFYDADGKLLEDVPDKPVVESEYKAVLKNLAGGQVFVARKRTGDDTAMSCEIAIDLEDDTYWLLIEYSKAVVEWDRFVAQAE